MKVYRVLDILEFCCFLRFLDVLTCSWWAFFIANQFLKSYCVVKRWKLNRAVQHQNAWNKWGLWEDVLHCNDLRPQPTAVDMGGSRTTAVHTTKRCWGCIFAKANLISRCKFTGQNHWSGLAAGWVEHGYGQLDEVTRRRKIDQPQKRFMQVSTDLYLHIEWRLSSYSS